MSPVKKNEPSWRIGTARRDDADKTMRRTNNFPAPTAYNPNFSTARSNDPKWGFGTGKRMPPKNEKVISPGM